MAIFDIYLDVAPDYLETIKDIYKFSIVLIVFQVLIHYSSTNKNIIQSSLSGVPVNDEFVTLLIYILLGLAFYHLVALKILSFH